MDRRNPGQNPYPRNPAPSPQRQNRIPGQPPHRNHVPRENPAEGERQPETLFEKFHGWRLGISIEIEPIIRALVCLVLISFFALLQTTLFTRFQPFGAVPDLMLPLVVAVSMIAREKWGAVTGLAAAFIIESLGGASVTILSLLYMPVGYICGLLTVYYFRDGFAVRALYTGVTALARVLFFPADPGAVQTQRQPARCRFVRHDSRIFRHCGLFVPAPSGGEICIPADGRKSKINRKNRKCRCMTRKEMPFPWKEMKTGIQSGIQSALSWHLWPDIPTGPSDGSVRKTDAGRPSVK